MSAHEHQTSWYYGCCCVFSGTAALDTGKTLAGAGTTDGKHASKTYSMSQASRYHIVECTCVHQFKCFASLTMFTRDHSQSVVYL